MGRTSPRSTSPAPATPSQLGSTTSAKIVGRYDDASGSPHGFFLDNTGFTTIDFPGASDTEAYGINGGGQVVGIYYDGLTYHGFVTIVSDPITHIAQLVPCAGPVLGGRWKNHGQYVSTVSNVATDFLADGLITHEEMDAVVSGAAKSRCGK